MKRFLSLLLFLLLFIPSCTDQEKKPCPVYIEVEAKEYENYMVDISLGIPPIMKTVNLYSRPKNPFADLSSLSDIHIHKIETVWRRKDGGTINPKTFTQAWTTLLPAGGNVTLNGLNLMSAEQLYEMPFTQLLPENGGVDKETGNKVIIVDAETIFYGRTVQGCDIESELMRTTFEFYYGGGGEK